MTSSAGASTFVFPGSALRRRSSLDVPMDETKSEPPPQPRVENPLLHNLRTPLAATHNSMTSPPLLPFSPFSPPPSLRAPSKYTFAASASTSDVWDTENLNLGLRQRKATTQSTAWTMLNSEEPKPDHILTKPSYSLGTNYYVPLSEPTLVLSTPAATTSEMVSPSDAGNHARSQVSRSNDLLSPNTFTVRVNHHLLLPTSTTDLFSRDASTKSPEHNSATTNHHHPLLHTVLTEDDILNYPDSDPLASSSRNFSCAEQLLRCLFGMDDDCEQRSVASGGITCSHIVNEHILR
jgi:hypothetical protein